MEGAKEEINRIANEICKRDIFIDFAGESDIESTLSNLVDYYFNELHTKQKSFELISIFDSLFPNSCETLHTFYFSTIMLSSLSRIENPNVIDYEDFLLKGILISVSSKDPFELLLNFSAKCFSSLFSSNNQLFLQSLKIVISSNACFSGYAINQIDFPPFRSLNDVQEIASFIIKTNNASSDIITKVIESFLKTDLSNIPDKIETEEDNFYKTLIQFAFSIIKKDKNHESILNMLKNQVYTEAVIKIAEKYFTISNEDSLIIDFISYLQFFKENRNYQTNLTSQLLSNINPTDINHAYDIARYLCRYNIFHITSPNLNDNIIYLKKLTDYCFDNIIVDDSNATAQFVNLLNNNSQEIHIFPYKKIERLCFYLLFKPSQEIRLNSFDLLMRESQLFEKENTDWKEYEFSSQPLYRQFCSEMTSYNRKNTDNSLEIREFISRSNLLQQTLKYVLRRFANNRPEFAVKILKECIMLCEQFPFMITLLFVVMTPYLLRQKCCKKVEIQHKLFYRFARLNVEALSNLEPTFLIDYLQFVADNEVELFLQLTKSGKANLKSIQKNQLQEEINVLGRLDKTSKVALVAESLLNVVEQLKVVYPKDNSIRLTLMTSNILNYLSVNSLKSDSNPIIKEAFVTFSNFLVDNDIDFNVKFIRDCDGDFFEKVYSKYPNKKDDIVFEALHFIPSIVTKYFLTQKTKNESVTSVRPEFTGYLFTPENSEEINQLFQSKYPSIQKPVNYESVISLLTDNQKKSLLYMCLQFFSTPFIEEIGERVYSTIYLLKGIDPISQMGEKEINSLYHFLFKHPQISPRDLFFKDEEGSYRFFKSFVEYGASDEVIIELLKKCPHSKSVSEKFLSQEWDYIEKRGNGQVNENTINAFRAIVGNKQISDKLMNCQNLGAYRVYLKKTISKAIEDNKLGIELFASILSNDNHQLNYYQIVEMFIAEMTEAIRETPEKFNLPILNTFFEICIVVVNLCNDAISHAVYNYIELIMNDENLRKLMFDKDFVSNVIKLSVIDDSFLSIITENKMKIKISEFINIDDDRETRFWYYMILRKFELINSENFEFILSNVSKALEFNSIEMKQRCLMILSIVIPDRFNVSDEMRDSIKNFVEYLFLSPNVDAKFSHHILLFIDEALGPFDLKLTDIDIDIYKNSVDDIRNYFASLQNH